MLICRDCNSEIPECNGATHTYSHADGSATIQCVPCHVKWHETDGGKHAPTFAGLERGCSACR